MIRLTAALHHRALWVNKATVQLVETPPEGTSSGAVITVAGQKIAVVESVADVVAMLQ